MFFFPPWIAMLQSLKVNSIQSSGKQFNLNVVLVLLIKIRRSSFYSYCCHTVCPFIFIIISIFISIYFCHFQHNLIEGQQYNKDDDIKNNPRKVFSTALDRIWSELASSGKETWKFKTVKLIEITWRTTDFN